MAKNSEEMGGSLDDLFFSDNSKVVEENEVELLNNQTS